MSNDDNRNQIKDKYLNNTEINEENVAVDNVKEKQIMIDFALIKGNLNVKDFLHKPIN